MEDEHIGEMAEQVKDTVKETGSEALERGKQVAQDAASAASDSASQQGQELSETLQDNVKQPETDVDWDRRPVIATELGGSHEPYWADSSDLPGGQEGE